MLVTRKSPFTGTEGTMEIATTQEKIDEYDSGYRSVQVVFPELTPGEREFIMTGITEEQWDDTFTDQ